MERKILIDCYKVYETGTRYSNDAEEIEQNQTKLTEIAENIEAIWKGPDGRNFLVSLRKHIDEMNDIIGFLDEKSDVLRGASTDHRTEDEEFTLKMKRSDENDESERINLYI